jgi:hypothetical protein
MNRAQEEGDMREGEIRTCECGCGQPLPLHSTAARRFLDEACRKRAKRALAREALTGMARAQGSPSPSRSGPPPLRRPPPDPPAPPDDPPLPINDPTVILRRRLLAEAEVLLSLPHVEAVTISVHAGTVTSMRSTWDVRDCGDHYEAAQVQAAGAPSFEVG